MENLFLTILSISLTTSIIIIALILLGSLINKRYVAKWKYGLWIALALRLLIPFNYTVSDSDFQITVPDEVGSLTVSDIFETGDEVVTAQPADYEGMEPKSAQPQTIVPQPAEPKTQPKVQSSFSIMQALSYLWAAVSVCLLIWQLTGYFYCKRRIVQRGKPAESPILTEQLHELCSELGIRKSVFLLIYENASSPMIIGFWRPVLVLPCDEYTPQESYYILKHELIHLKRHDILVKFLLMLARDIHWFNPVIYLMQREAAVDMELACDEAVVRGSSYDQREAYTETLMSILHGKQRRGPVLSTQFSGGVRIMKKRFRNILSKANKKNGAVLFSAILIMTVIIGTMVGCSMEQPIPELLGGAIPGQNTVGDALLSMSAGAEELLNLRAGGEDMAGLHTEAENDISDMASASGEIQGGRADSTVLTVMKEGMAEVIPATLYKGEGYSIYVTDGMWDNFVPDAWQANANGQVIFSINSYEGLNKSQVERLLTAQGYVAENGELWWQSFPGDDEFSRMYRTICYETENDVWTFTVSYPPGEAEEGWLPEIRAIAETFAVDAGYDVGAHTAKAVMPEGEQLKLYEVTYTDRRNRDWYSRDREEMKGYYIYDEITVSNITDTTFDFTVTWSDPETGESGVIIPLSTAYINEDQISATYTGEDYTLTFDFSYINNPLPEVLWIRLWGVDELEGLLFTNTKIPGHEWE